MLFLVANYAHADKCWPEFVLAQQANPDDYLMENSDVVFIGAPSYKKFVYLESDNNASILLRRETTFTVVDPIKPADQVGAVTVVYDGKAPCGCNIDFEYDKKYKVFASHIGVKPSSYEILFCNQISTVK